MDEHLPTRSPHLWQYRHGVFYSSAVCRWPSFRVRQPGRPTWFADSSATSALRSSSTGGGITEWVRRATTFLGYRTRGPQLAFRYRLKWNRNGFVEKSLFRFFVSNLVSTTTGVTVFKILHAYRSVIVFGTGFDVDNDNQIITRWPRCYVVLWSFCLLILSF